MNKQKRQNDCYIFKSSKLQIVLLESRGALPVGGTDSTRGLTVSDKNRRVSTELWSLLIYNIHVIEKLYIIHQKFP